jgi:hypothetical protein
MPRLYPDMSPSSQGSSSVVRETPKSARRAHRQTERSKSILQPIVPEHPHTDLHVCVTERMFGTESLINQSISFSLLTDKDERIFSPEVHSDPSHVPGSASSGHGSLSLRAEPTILEDEPEPAGRSFQLLCLELPSLHADHAVLLVQTTP